MVKKLDRESVYMILLILFFVIAMVLGFVFMNHYFFLLIAALLLSFFIGSFFINDDPQYIGSLGLGVLSILLFFGFHYIGFYTLIVFAIFSVIRYLSNLYSHKKYADKLTKLKEKEQRQFFEECRVLDKYLFSTLNRTIEIDIARPPRGDELPYVLKDYKLDVRGKMLRLELERNGESVLFDLKVIWMIDNILHENVMETWIFRKSRERRFLLKFDPSIVNSSIESGRLSIE